MILDCFILQISSSTVNSVSQYSSLVSSTCDELDASIKSMYVMMARCEELVKVMSKVPKLQESLYPFKFRDC
ncbi:unnamed protein product [Mesocestoides corti]|uniref:BLOC-1-related complex subunit 6 C-terminal helix domain-containing protein n=1 Tax=Mesocestoides corti TaxID=53468 RepID=A0A0R3UFL6_MESCO|nr:unnamed protein product [Mesocestoides corti]